MAAQPRSILRSTTQSTNTTRRVTWADGPALVGRPPPPSVAPPARRAGQRRPRDPRPHLAAAHDSAARRRRRADGVVKKRTAVHVRRADAKKKKKKPGSHSGKRKKKCKRGLLYARQYVVSKCHLKDDHIVHLLDARTLFKIYAEIRARLGKKVHQGLKRRMAEDESNLAVDRRAVRRKRRELDSFVNKMLPGVRAEAFSRSQLSRAAFAAVVNRFDRVQRERSAERRSARR